MRGPLRSLPERAAYLASGFAIVVGCALYYRALWPDYSAFQSDIDPKCGATFCDFYYFYYKQAQSILSDPTPVKKYYYSPAFALLLVPLGRLPLEAALEAWTWVQALSLVLLIIASLLALRGFPRWTHALVLFLTLTSFPVLNNWKWGQANTTFMALIVLSIALAERGRAAPAALSLSLVVASRYYPAIYALGLLARRRLKVLAWCIGLTLLLAIVWPVLAMGAEQAFQFYARSAASIDDAVQHMTRNRGSLYWPHTLLRLKRLYRWSGTWPFETWRAIAGSLAGCNALTVLWIGHKGVAHRALWAFCLCALSTPLLAPTSWVHYFVFMPLVQTFVAAQLVQLRAPCPLRVIGLFGIWLPSVAVTTIFFFKWDHSSQALVELGYVLFADLALLALSYGLLGRALAAPEHARALQPRRALGPALAQNKNRPV